MRKLYVVLICVLGVSFTGCIKDYPLSETQSDTVAEYMASRILDNDKGYSPTLLSYQDAFATEGEFFEDMPEPTGIPEPTMIPEPTGIPGSSIDDDKEGASSSDLPAHTYYTLTDVIGEEGFDIQYTSYKLVDTYPEDESNLVFSLDPREGYQLLVVNFTIENKADGDKTIDLSKAGIQYQLDINVGTVYKPQLALLENNLQYINLNVKAEDKIQAVLIFEVSRDIDISKINLFVSRDTRTKIMEIK